MANYLASTVSWLDHDEEQRRRMREVVHMFRDKGAVDELGMGRIRDAFSDRLCPGTSVLWRRARYLLFVPWVYTSLETGGGGKGSAEDRARRLYRQLAQALRTAAGDNAGVIGASGADVKQTPDVILWAALGAWGVRRDWGRLGQVRAESAARSRRRRMLEEDGETPGRAWHPGAVGLLPPGFPAVASFDLTAGEATFLRHRILEEDALAGSDGARRRDSLLAVLVREGCPDNVELPWEHPLDSASDALRDVVRHAGLFSDVLQGARLLYADLVARSRDDQDLARGVDDAFGRWTVTADARRFAEVEEWANDSTDFWRTVRTINPRVSAPEERFVREWSALVVADPTAVRASEAARRLVIERERYQKGATRARLNLDGSIGRDANALLPARLTFRWSQAVSICDDVRAGCA